MNKTLPILLCLSLCLSLAGCGTEEAPVMDTTVTVETAAVETGDLSSQSTYIGTISAEGTASVIAQVSGTVEEIAVSVGDTVEAGTLLCRFDDESARIALQSAQAAYQSALTGVASAEAAVSSAQESYQSALAGYGGTEDGSLTVLEEQVRLAQDNYEDTQALFEIGAASQAEVDQAYQTLLSAQAGLESARAALSAAQAGVDSAQVGISSAEYQLSLYNLTTPISGVVEAVNVTENNFTSAGTAAFVISNGNNKTVTFYVTEQVRKGLELGQPVTVAYNGNSYTGAITEISGVVDAAVGQFEVEAVIDGAQDLPDGLAVELTTTAYQADDALLIPSDALYFENGEAYVYLMQDGAAVRANVEIGLYTADTIAVTGGLSQGDQVIVSWSASLRDGAPVRLAEAAEDGAAAGAEES